MNKRTVATFVISLVMVLTLSACGTRPNTTTTIAPFNTSPSPTSGASKVTTVPSETAPTLTPTSAPTSTPSQAPSNKAEQTDPETPGLHQAKQKYAKILSCYRDLALLWKSPEASSSDEAESSKFDEVLNNLSEKLIIEANIIDPKGEGEPSYHIWCSCVETRDNIGYAIKDLNNDGILDLIILSDDYNVSAIYTIINNKTMLVDAFWSRHACQVDKNCILHVTSSGGAGDYYVATYVITAKKAEMGLIEMTGVETYDDQTGESFSKGRCYQIKNGKKTIISYDDLDKAVENFPENATKDAGITFIPLT